MKSPGESLTVMKVRTNGRMKTSKTQTNKRMKLKNPTGSPLMGSGLGVVFGVCYFPYFIRSLFNIS